MACNRIGENPPPGRGQTFKQIPGGWTEAELCEFVAKLSSNWRKFKGPEAESRGGRELKLPQLESSRDWIVLKRLC